MKTMQFSRNLFQRINRIIKKLAIGGLKAAISCVRNQYSTIKFNPIHTSLISQILWIH